MEPHANERQLPPLQPESGSSWQGNNIESSPLDAKAETSPDQPMEQLKDTRSFEREKQSATQLGATTLPMPQIADDHADDVAPLPDPVTPISANDDDVIEKEWVTKSKKVVESTKGDPYAREQDVSKLQADYIQKRYGKQIKIPEDA